jgi:hypothetical protein
MSIRTRVRTALTMRRLVLVAIIAAGLMPAAAPGQESNPGPGATEQVAPESPSKPKRERPPKGHAGRPARKAPDPTVRRRLQQEFVDRLAAKLGITAEQLNTAIKGVRIDLVDRAVAEGQLSREQADRTIELLNQRGDATQPAPPRTAGPAKPDPGEGAAPRVATISDLAVSFKLDPRLTRSLYMGDRWVSPPTYMGAQEGNAFTVEARVHGLNNGERMSISPQWLPSDPEMVAVSPGRGSEVTISVRRAGESTVNIAGPGFSKALAIKAIRTNDGKVLQVEISQAAMKHVPSTKATGSTALEARRPSP